MRFYLAIFLILSLSSAAFAATESPKTARVCKAAVLGQPQIPEGAKVLFESDFYVVYSHDSELRILFDAREAELLNGYVKPSLNGTDRTGVTLNRLTDRPVIFEGRHRVVSAGHGFPIRPELGGTDHLYWLDFRFADLRFDSLNKFEGQSLAKDVEVTWDSSPFE